MSITQKSFALQTSSWVAANDRAARVRIDRCFILPFEQQLSFNTLQLHCTLCLHLKLSLLPRGPLPAHSTPPPLQRSHPSREHRVHRHPVRSTRFLGYLEWHPLCNSHRNRDQSALKHLRVNLLNGPVD